MDESELIKENKELKQRVKELENEVETYKEGNKILKKTIDMLR